MTEIEREISMLDYVAIQAEECLEWLEELEKYDDKRKIEPLCKFLRIVRNDNVKRQKYIEESIDIFDIYKAYDKYQELEKKGVEIHYYHSLEILAPLCDEIGYLFIELINIMKF